MLRQNEQVRIFFPTMIKMSKGNFTNAYCQFAQINTNVVPNCPEQKNF